MLNAEISKFFAKLRKVKKEHPEFIWTVGDAGFVRATCKEKLYCPITAVAFIIYGESYKLAQYDETTLNCNTSNINVIARAADNCCYTKLDKETRKKLLQTLHLIPDVS